MGVKGKATVRHFALQNIILSIMCSYIAEIYATYFFTDSRYTAVEFSHFKNASVWDPDRGIRLALK